VLPVLRTDVNEVGVAQLLCFPSLNVYCLEFDPFAASEVIDKSGSRIL
jgi:hypothetical protein